MSVEGTLKCYAWFRVWADEKANSNWNTINPRRAGALNMGGKNQYEGKENNHNKTSEHMTSNKKFILKNSHSTTLNRKSEPTPQTNEHNIDFSNNKGNIQHKIANSSQQVNKHKNSHTARTEKYTSSNSDSDSSDDEQPASKKPASSSSDSDSSDEGNAGSAKKPVGVVVSGVKTGMGVVPQGAAAQSVQKKKVAAAPSSSDSDSSDDEQPASKKPALVKASPSVGKAVSGVVAGGKKVVGKPASSSSDSDSSDEGNAGSAKKPVGVVVSGVKTGMGVVPQGAAAQSVQKKKVAAAPSSSDSDSSDDEQPASKKPALVKASPSVGKAVSGVVAGGKKVVGKPASSSSDSDSSDEGNAGSAKKPVGVVVSGVKTGMGVVPQGAAAQSVQKKKVAAAPSSSDSDSSDDEQPASKKPALVKASPSVGKAVSGVVAGGKKVVGKPASSSSDSDSSDEGNAGSAKKPVGVVVSGVKTGMGVVPQGAAAQSVQKKKVAAAPSSSDSDSSDDEQPASKKPALVKASPSVGKAVSGVVAGGKKVVGKPASSSSDSDSSDEGNAGSAKKPVGVVVSGVKTGMGVVPQGAAAQSVQKKKVAAAPSSSDSDSSDDEQPASKKPALVKASPSVGKAVSGVVAGGKKVVGKPASSSSDSDSSDEGNAGSAKKPVGVVVSGVKTGMGVVPQGAAAQSVQKKKVAAAPSSSDSDSSDDEQPASKKPALVKASPSVGKAVSGVVAGGKKVVGKPASSSSDSDSSDEGNAGSAKKPVGVVVSGVKTGMGVVPQGAAAQSVQKKKVAAAPSSSDSDSSDDEQPASKKPALVKASPSVGKAVSGVVAGGKKVVGKPASSSSDSDSSDEGNAGSAKKPVGVVVSGVKTGMGVVPQGAAAQSVQKKKVAAAPSSSDSDSSDDEQPASKKPALVKASPSVGKAVSGVVAGGKKVVGKPASSSSDSDSSDEGNAGSAKKPVGVVVSGVKTGMGVVPQGAAAQSVQKKKVAAAPSSSDSDSSDDEQPASKKPALVKASPSVGKAVSGVVAGGKKVVGKPASSSSDSDSSDEGNAGSAKKPVGVVVSGVKTGMGVVPQGAAAQSVQKKKVAAAPSSSDSDSSDDEQPASKKPALVKASPSVGKAVSGVVAGGKKVVGKPASSSSDSDSSDEGNAGSAKKPVGVVVSGVKTGMGVVPQGAAAQSVQKKKVAAAPSSSDSDSSDDEQPASKKPALVKASPSVGKAVSGVVAGGKKVVGKPASSSSDSDSSDEGNAGSAKKPVGVVVSGVKTGMGVVPQGAAAQSVQKKKVAAAPSSSDSDSSDDEQPASKKPALVKASPSVGKAVSGVVAGGKKVVGKPASSSSDSDSSDEGNAGSAKKPVGVVVSGVKTGMGVVPQGAAAQSVQKKKVAAAPSSSDSDSSDDEQPASKKPALVKASPSVGKAVSGVVAGGKKVVGKPASSSSDSDSSDEGNAGSAKKPVGVVVSGVKTGMGVVPQGAAAQSVQKKKVAAAPSSSDSDSSDDEQPASKKPALVKASPSVGKAVSGVVAGGKKVVGKPASSSSDSDSSDEGNAGSAKKPVGVVVSGVKTGMGVVPQGAAAQSVQKKKVAAAPSSSDSDSSDDEQPASKKPALVKASPSVGKAVSGVVAGGKKVVGKPASSSSDSDSSDEGNAGSAKKPVGVVVSGVKTGMGVVPQGAAAQSVQKKKVAAAPSSSDSDSSDDEQPASKKPALVKASPSVGKAVSGVVAGGKKVVGKPASSSSDSDSSDEGNAGSAKKPVGVVVSGVKTGMGVVPQGAAAQSVQKKKVAAAPSSSDSDSSDDEQPASKKPALVKASPSVGKAVSGVVAGGKKVVGKPASSSSDSDSSDEGNAGSAKKPVGVVVSGVKTGMGVVPQGAAAQSVQKKKVAAAPSSSDSDSSDDEQPASKKPALVKASPSVGKAVSGVVAGGKKVVGKPASSSSDSDSSDEGNAGSAKKPVGVVVSGVKTGMGVVPQGAAAQSVQKKKVAAAPSSSDSDSSDDEQPASKKPALVKASPSVGKAVSGVVAGGKKVVGKPASSSSDSDSSDEGNAGSAKKPVGVVVSGVKTGMGVVPQGAAAQSVQKKKVAAAPSSSDSDSSDDEQPASKKPALVKASPSVGKAVSGVVAGGKKVVGKPASSSSDSDSSDEGNAGSAKKPVGVVVSGVKTGMGVVPQGAAAQSVQKKKVAAAPSSSDSDSSDDEQPASKKPALVKASPSACKDVGCVVSGLENVVFNSTFADGDGHVRGDLLGHSFNRKRRFSFVCSGDFKNRSSVVSSTDNLRSVTKTSFTDSNGPFRRVDEKDVFVHPNLRDNSFEAKRNARGSWGEKANRDFKFTSGKAFKQEKTKKKRGSYSGGSLSLDSCSFKFNE
ncbi:unnamed protein product [Schistosoma intercalatum]|nr:unnamed protein product [Schistosoma intercalatum]